MTRLYSLSSWFCASAAIALAVLVPLTGPEGAFADTGTDCTMSCYSNCEIEYGYGTAGYWNCFGTCDGVCCYNACNGDVNCQNACCEQGCGSNQNCLTNCTALATPINCGICDPQYPDGYGVCNGGTQTDGARVTAMCKLGARMTRILLALSFVADGDVTPTFRRVLNGWPNGVFSELRKRN